MATTFSPTKEDVDRYQQRRAALSILNQRMIKTIPEQAYAEIGDAIGIRRNGLIVFDNEQESSVLADCCLYDWLEDSKNLIERYLETHAETLRPNQTWLLDACLRDEYRILVHDDFLPGAGVHCLDVLSGERIFLMDIGLSRTPELLAWATRTIPFGAYWITSGAALPIASPSTIKNVEHLMKQARFADLPDSLLIVRACLAAGAAEQVRYLDMPSNVMDRVRKVSGAVDPTDLCPCRSGLMFKYCCGRVKSQGAANT
jgi:hypothetical protein